jgi:hypothetical protein
MRKPILAVMAIALVCAMATNANAGPNHNGKFALHLAGPHDDKANTCDYVMTDCFSEMVTEVSESGSADYDIYVIAVDVSNLAGARFGLYCENTVGLPFFFSGWQSCADFEVMTAGFPGCGEGNSESFSTPEPGPNVTLGIIDLYIYPGTNAKLCTTKDPRVDYAEFCDGSQPLPQCDKTTLSAAFGCVGFNRFGYNPCGPTPVMQKSWGAVKSLYR